VNEKHEFAKDRTKYKLANPDVLEIVKIEGTVNGAPFIFRKGADYRLSDNMVEWLRLGDKPGDRTPFFVNYRLDAPQGITDINPGSVIRTIVESFALEIDYLYAQMNHVYNSGFIDSSTGKSLDLVVSILGIDRKTAGFATGEVTFGRNSEPGKVEVLREANVHDGKDRYALKNPMLESIKKLDGTSGGVQTTFTKDGDYKLSDNAIVWTEGGRKPDQGSVFYTDYTAYEQITIPVDTKVSTYSRRPENLKVYRTMREAVLSRNPEGKWEIEIPVVALTSGKEGNIFAGTLNVMPRPPIGIEYVINKKDILNGTEDESDEELRERAKRALEMAGKATLISLKSAVQGVPGVTGEVKVVDQPDGVPGIVQIIASGGDEKEIENMINETRSAGIKVEFKRPSIIPLDIKLTIIAVEGVGKNEVTDKVDNSIRQYLGTLNIDDDVIVSSIIKSALMVQGVRDVQDVTINGKKENIEVKSDEKGELRNLQLFTEE